MLILIFAGGEMKEMDELTALLKQAGKVIAADGGARHCQRLDIVPDLLIGDLDSIEPNLLADYHINGVAIDQYPSRKDATDLELALDAAMACQPDHIWLIGALGQRWDMSISSLLLAASDKYSNSALSILHRDATLHILHPGRKHNISGFAGQTLSLIPLRGNAEGVTLKGCEYPLNKSKIVFGSTRGISNIFLESSASLEHDEGVILCVLTK